MAVTLEDVSYRLLPRVAPGRALADSEWRTLSRVSETLLEACPVCVAPERVADNVERFLIRGRSRRAWRVRVLLNLIEVVTVPFYGARFSALSPAARRRVVEERYIDGRHVWGVCAKIRLLVMSGIYGDKSAQAATGFVPVSHRIRYRQDMAPSAKLEAAS